MKICQSPDVVKIRQKIAVILHEDLSVFHAVVNGVCSVTAYRLYCCFHVSSFSVYYIVDSNMHQQYKMNTFLHFHGSSGYMNAPVLQLHTLPFVI